MLEKAQDRISKIINGRIRIFHDDFREIELPKQHYDVTLATAVLHHLRDDRDWEDTFRKIYHLTAPGGSIWITDLVSHESNNVQSFMWERYGEYPISIGGESYKRESV
jgi:tRNA (cmo5U34)-methyltransferase